MIQRVLPDAIGLTDAFGFSDRSLDSCIGRFDGNVYPAMFARAQKAHINRSLVPRGYAKYLRPLLQQAKWPALNRTTPRSKL